jgi:DNA-binding beta-propeller fold protein YncE
MKARVSGFDPNSPSCCTRLFIQLHWLADRTAKVRILLEGDDLMRQFCLAFALLALTGAAQDGPYKVLKTVKAGGDGGFDYVTGDAEGRRLYVGRSGNPGRVTVFDLDTLEKTGEVPNTLRVHGATVSPKSNHGFASSNPVVMFDSKTLATIKTIDVKGNPDGYLYDPYNDRVYILSHSKPHVTAIDAASGSVVGTIDDLGGAPEQAATDGKGAVYVDIEDAHSIAVVDAKTLTVKTHYDLGDKGDGCAGLALDIKNEILFAACRNPQNMVILSAKDGKILNTFPLAGSSDGAAFNPKTMEAFSSHGNGTLSIIKENSPTSFAVEQTVQTMTGAKTMTLDPKTGRILLIAAEYVTPAAPPPDTQPPAEKKGRGPARQMVPDSFSIVVVGK